MESDLKKDIAEFREFTKEKSSRLRKDNLQKILAEGFLTKHSEGCFEIGDYKLPCGAEVEIKFEESWVKMQVQSDEAGNHFLTNTTCSFYPIKAYARFWGKSDY